jgi:8-hydroxy-5-deazaflavin:NADPH oxidoreductase
MKVAIIGTGNVGTALGGSIVRAGHDVTMTGVDDDKAQRVASDVGASFARTPAEAAAAAEVVILAVPYGALIDVANAIGEIADGKVLIDVTNPLTPDYSGLATDGGPSAAEQLATALPSARVVKAFNSLFGSLQGDPDALGTKVDALFATDDDEARERVVELIDSIGFRAVDAGPLDAARQMESLAWLNMRMQMRYGGDWRSTFALVAAPVGATPSRRRELVHA